MNSATDPGQTARRAALTVLAVCAALVATFPAAEATRTPPIAYPVVALGLGMAAILCRQQSIGSTRRGQSSIVATIGVFALSAAIGVVGLVLVWMEGLRDTALLYAAGGAILALRPMRAHPLAGGRANRPGDIGAEP